VVTEVSGEAAGEVATAKGRVQRCRRLTPEVWRVGQDEIKLLPPHGFEEIAEANLDPVVHPVDLGVDPRALDRSGVAVNGHHPGRRRRCGDGEDPGAGSHVENP